MGHPECDLWVPHSSRLYRDGWGCGSFAAGPGPVGFDFDATGFAGGQVFIAAPGPVFGFLDEAAFDGVAVDVPEFLDPLSMSEHVEVVVAGLPELEPVAFEQF